VTGEGFHASTASRHSIVSSGRKIGFLAASNPFRRIHWISPIHTDTRANSAA
jgi:hypothetical protein